MNRKPHSFVTLGITSLFLIFSVLCLVVLALLTFGTARSDLSMSRLSMKQTKGYYQACSAATDLYRQGEEFLSKAFRETAGESGYFARVKDGLADALAATAADCRVHYQEKLRLLSIYVPFSDTQELYVELQPAYPREKDGVCLDILTWKTQVSGTWQPDARQPVFKGELQ